MMTVGDRGIVALPVELPWGKEGALIEVLSEDFANGIARKDIGLTVDSDGTKRIRGALSYAYKGLLYRMNKGGAKASLSLGSLYCEAVYSGELGNRIKIAVIDNENDTYTVITYLDGSVVDSQTVVSLPELSANPYVLFKEYQKFKVTIGGTVATGDTFTVEGVTDIPYISNLQQYFLYTGGIMKIIDLTGRKFGRLTVTSLNPKRNKYKKLLWNCKCDCGNTIVAIGSLLKRGNIKSCGCLYKETRPFVAQKHKGSKTRLYCLWNGIKSRCFNKNHKEYKFYGGKGIKICEEWLDFDTFRKWAYNNGYEEWPVESSSKAPEENPFKTGNLTEQGKIYKADPEKARVLYKEATGKNAPW